MKLKIYLIPLLFLLFTVGNLTSQTYILSPPGGSVFTTCKGFVENDLACYDPPVCSQIYYFQGDNYFTTFQSGTPGMPIRMNFTFLDLNTGDFVRVYQGTGTAGPLLATFTNTYTTLGSAITSTTGVITIRFTTNNDNNVGTGYTAILGCPPVSCGSNLPAGDDCTSTTRICDTQPYCGNTGGWYTADHENIAATNAEANLPTPFTTNNTFCGSIENNSWLVFTANTPSPTFSVNVANCASSTSGIQMLMLASSNCNTFAAVSSCISQSAAPTSFTVGAITALTPGTDYYIMIDGFAGNYCDYTVTPLAGVQIATLNPGASALCQNQTTILTTSNTVPGSTFSWAASTPGAIGGSPISLSITATPTVVGTTVYTVTITQPNGCAVQSFTRSILLNPLPAANAGTTPASITCSSPNQTLGGSGGGTYSWSGSGIVSGATTANPVVNQPGPFSLVVTSGAGCTSTNVATVSVPVNTVVPIPAISSPTVLNCAITSMNLTGSPGSGVNYAWTGPGIVSGGSTASPLINAGGTYNLNVTSTVNGCSAGTSIAIAAPNTSIVVSPSTTGSVTCGNTSINLSTPAQAGQNYTWTAPSGAVITAGANSAAATGSNSGTYSVTVYNTTNGCSQVGIIAANVNIATPAANASNSGVVTCASTALNLSSTSTGVTYTWVPPAGSSIASGGNTANASANGGGTYTLFITSTVNSCTNSALTTAVTQTVRPIPSITNTPVITCSNPVVTVNGAPASSVTYTWSGGTIVGSANNANANVSATGVYSLAVTSPSNGCTSTTPATVNITSNLATPVVSPVGSQTASSGCGTSSIVILSGTATPAGSTYTWASSGGFASGVNNASVAVNGATTYTLSSTHPVTGCISSLVFTVSPSVNQPTLTSSSATGTITCANTSTSTTVTSNPSSGVTYSWTGPGIVGSTTGASVTGSLSGTYNLTVTNTSNNCNSTSSYIISANNTPITPNASASNSVDCSNTTATISTAPTPTASGFTYSWSTGATTSSVVVSPTANTNYTVTVTNPSNGCTGTSVFNVTANTVPPSAVSISPNNVVLACPAQTANLTGSATGAISYTWIAPSGGSIISGANTATAQVTSSSIGTFSLIATGANGCSSAAAMATVSPNTNAPTFTLSNANPSITCLTSSPAVTVGLTSTVSILSYSWSPGSGISGPTNTSVVTFTAAGTYTGVITATNGCISTTTVSVSNATIAPSVVAGTGTAQAISCTNTLITIAPTFTPSANLTYTWSGPGVVGSANNPSVQVNQNGSYSLTVTNTLTGCSSTSITIPVVGTNVPPSLTVSSTSSIGISCQPNTNTVSLSANSSGAVTYSWSSGATSSVINTANAGNYTVTVTDTGSGCTASQTVAVANNTTSPSFTAAAAGALPCGTAGTTTLNAAGSSTNIAYVWNGPAITSGSNTANPQVSGAGTYTVIATDNITGCTSTQTVSVNSTSVLAQFGQNVNSGLSPLMVNFTNQSVGAATYSWNFGNGTSTQNNPSNTFTSGTYTVVLLALNGACTSTADVIIKVNENLGVIPEVFTPNGDGHNETFQINGLDSYPGNSLEIFNRWGNQVFYAKPYKNDWDGSHKAGGSKLPTGTYFYILDLGTGNKSDNIKAYIQLQY